MTVSINISGLEGIAEAIQNLARAMGASGVTANLRYKETAAPPVQQPVPGMVATSQLPAGSAQQPVSASHPNPAPAVSGSYPTGVPTAPVQPQGVPASMHGGPFPSAGAPAPMPPMSGPVPTTAPAPAYTQDQIAVAMTGLVDQGKQPQVMQVLSQFGAASLMQVSKEQYGALATQLRMLGANL